MMITTTLLRKIAVEMASLVRTSTEWYAIGTAFHQDAICRRSLDEGEPGGNECSDNGSKAEERRN